MNEDRNAASTEILDICKDIALQMMKLHKPTRALADEDAQNEILKASHDLTVALETVKKTVIKLEKRDGSSEL